MVSLKEALNIRRPWSWFIGGIFFGIAELIYAFWYVFNKNTYHYITVTTQLAGFFSAMEEFFGYSIVRRALKPDVHWYIWALILFTMLLAWIENDHRSWVKYNWKYILASFIGGAIFSYGTRLAAGCTLNHMFGGFPTMTTASFFVMLGIIAGALPAFYFAQKWFGPYIKAWEYGDSFPEYRMVCKQYGLSSELETYEEGYRAYKNPLYLAGIFFISFLAVLTLYKGLTVSYDVTNTFKHGLANMGWGYIIASIFAALFTALGAFKPGTGSVCGEIAPEASALIAKNYKAFNENGLPGSTMLMFRSLQPLIGVLTAMIITGFGGFISVFILGVPITYKETLYLPNLSHIVGGILLGIGAVFILGCEFRTYVRVGSGFSNSIAAFIGFYFGYFPYALAKDSHLNFMTSTTFMHKYFFFEYFSNPTVQAIVYLLWLGMLLIFLILAITLGSKTLGIPKSDLLLKPSVQIFTELIQNPTEETKDLVDTLKGQDS